MFLEMSAGVILCLERCQWDWFVSCTVPERGASESMLWKRLFALLRALCKRQEIKLQSLRLAVRIESGVDPEHRHFHFLVGGLRSIGKSERMWLRYEWRVKCGDKHAGDWNKSPRGTCVVRLYEASAGAEAYLSKVLNQSELYGWSREFVWFSVAAKDEIRRSVSVHRARSNFLCRT